MIGYKFGTVCSYNEREWIFLVETQDTIYLGKILNPQETQAVEHGAENSTRKNKPVERMPIFSYVILKTKELENRAAHFGNPNRSSNITDQFHALNITLLKEDLEAIKEEITRDGCVNIELKELVGKIAI